MFFGWRVSQIKLFTIILSCSSNSTLYRISPLYGIFVIFGPTNSSARTILPLYITKWFLLMIVFLLGIFGPSASFAKCITYLSGVIFFVIATIVLLRIVCILVSNESIATGPKLVIT